MHVDHIKPRSKYPHLAYDVNNLQVLCQDCNFGKSNHDETDWRREVVQVIRDFPLIERQVLRLRDLVNSRRQIIT